MDKSDDHKNEYTCEQKKMAALDANAAQIRQAFDGVHIIIDYFARVTITFQFKTSLKRSQYQANRTVISQNIRRKAHNESYWTTSPVDFLQDN